MVGVGFVVALQLSVNSDIQSSTIQARTTEQEGTKVPTLYLVANICRSSTGSSISWRKGSYDKLMQKSDQMDQDVGAPDALPTEMVLAASSLIVPSS